MQIGNVINAKLATDSVSTIKVQDGAITEAKLATNSVTNAKIADGSIDGAKLTDNTVDVDKIKGLDIVTTAEQNAGTPRGLVLMTYLHLLVLSSVVMMFFIKTQPLAVLTQLLVNCGTPTVVTKLFRSGVVVTGLVSPLAVRLLPSQL